MRFVLSLLVLVCAPQAHAWGRLGHSIIGVTAAYLVSDETKDDFFKTHSYDIGYYANTPDFFWKQPSTYEVEHAQHFMDLEIFERALKNFKEGDPYSLSREEFDSKFPEIPQSAGRSWWRIRELNDLLTATKQKLNEKELSKEDRFENQANWLLLSGVIGHYVGDLGQPLHVTENFNGQLTHQQGVHGYFEETVVDELHGSLEDKVLRESQKRWKMFHKKNSTVPLLTLLKDMSNISHSDLSELLKIDKKIGQKDLKKAVLAYRGMIEERITVASLYLAEIIVRQANFTPNKDHFFIFRGKAEFIPPGKAGTLPTLAPKTSE